MKVIKKFTAIQLHTQKVDENLNVLLTYGEGTGPYYSRSSPEEEFDSEENAIGYAFRIAPYSTWLILPMVSFNNFEDD